MLTANAPGYVKVGRALLLAVLLAACAGPASTGLQTGDPAPDFTLPAATGGEVTRSDFQGQPVLLYFHMAVG